MVEELQGLYGPYAFPERLLQRIWLDGLFTTRGARLADGRTLEVFYPGRWNRIGGPDFKGARIRIGERDIHGDVEVHFHGVDWVRHGHHLDPAYADVVLHVVLFEPPERSAPAHTVDGREVAVFVLLPWLQVSLEEFANDAALEALAQRDSVDWAEPLLSWPAEQRPGLVREAARRRWRQKVHFAGARIARLGWEAACHHTALEILGYSANRAAMLFVAEHLPLECWRNNDVETHALALGEGRWMRQGVRPANAPEHRLRQYREWVASVPQWPAQLLMHERSAVLAVAEERLADLAAIRRDFGWKVWCQELSTTVVGGAVGGGRLATIIGNGLLPLLSARTGADLWLRWYCCEPSEVPSGILRALQIVGVCGRRGLPRHEGAVQGMLQMVTDRLTPREYAGSAGPNCGVTS
jgi:hypothetical protein